MKFGLYILSALVFVAASCSKDGGPRHNALEAQQEAVHFSAYTSGIVTRGTWYEPSDVCGSATSAGIGVFAFQQNAFNGKKVNFNTNTFLRPDFMYNQQVGLWNGSAWTWDYTPAKYWPNGENDQLSFFAYAPFSEDAMWEDLGLETDIVGSQITASVPVMSEKSAMRDVYWADPVLNVCPRNTNGASIMDYTVDFDFRHIFSKLRLFIGVDDSSTPGGTAEAWTDTNTVVTVHNIKFSGIASSYDFKQTISASPVTTWKAEGSMELILSGDDLQNSVIVDSLWNQAWWDAHPVSGDVPAYFKDILSPDNAKPACLFLAPQIFAAGEQKLSVTYTVATNDPADIHNGFRNTYTVTKELADILPQLKEGHAYAIRILLGMGMVAMDGEVTDWNTVEL